jgi:Uma2 family endonuclease
MGSTATLVSLDEYLNTSYEPDMEFVDGALVRRNVGTQLHSLLHAIVAGHFREYRKSHGIKVFVEARLLVDAATRRHRIPDVMVLNTPYRRGKVVVDAPAIIVEIKSPDDTFDDIVSRCFDYEKLRVGNILVMDPDNKRAWLFNQGTLQLLADASISLNLLQQKEPIGFPFDQMFAELDEE